MRRENDIGRHLVESPGSKEQSKEGLAQEKRELSATKQALLKERLRAATTKGAAAPSIPRARRDGQIPSSFAQERLWFLDQLEPGSAGYVIPCAVSIRGHLDTLALTRALQELLRRHESLRTGFGSENGSPVQLIAADAVLSIQRIDLTSITGASDRERETKRILREEARRPFDLTRPPLFRARLLLLSETEHVLLLTLHHIISDAWSFGVLFEELAAIYEAFAGGLVSPLPEPPIQYADFAVWQRERFSGEVFDQQLAFWRKQLTGASGVLELRTDRPRPARQSYRGAERTFTFPHSLNDALNQLARRESATLFMVLLAAFNALLARYTGEQDIIVGSPIANRGLPELEPLVGFFVNTLALRTDLSGDPTFRELLRRVREVALESYAHQDLPFERIVADLRPERELGRNPLFQVMLILQNTPLQPPKLSGLTLELLELDTDTTIFDITASLAEHSAGLSCSFEYNRDLFEPATIEGLGHHFRILLEGVVANPEARISSLPLLPETERRQILVDWNQTAADYPNACISELFEAQVERTPDRTALVDGRSGIDYRDLNVRANRLAHHLRGLGVGPETLVGVCLERSIEMTVALLGILKAGAAYVPLDPTHPPRRLALLIDDTRPVVVVTNERFSRNLPPSAVRILRLDSEADKIASQPERNPPTLSSPLSPAYVIHTSGSTGLPKGVVGLHRGAVNRFAWMWRTYPFGPQETCCQRTSLSFVDSTWEIFGPLLQGVRSVVISDEVAQDPARLVEALADARVTRIVLVPSLLSALLNSLGDLQSRLPDLALWVTSGEPLMAELARRFRKTLPGRTLLNLYGSSEVSADVTCAEITRSGPEAPISIGRPIANTRTYILDRALQPVPVGVVGELHVAGVGLARSYWNRPELTAEKFIADPFDSLGGRLYRTGDLARYVGEGSIQYLGRLDDQVKVRGFRIEPGEVESAIGQCEAVRECVVTARGEPGADRELVAYLVPQSAEGVTASTLRSFLRSSLPDYMVPSTFILVDSFPLLPNGKVDRKVLPEGNRPARESALVEPRTPTEQVLARVFGEVLRLPAVGVEDDFFDLGGHSLMAMQVVSRLRAAFDVDVKLRSLFEHPTVEGMATVIEQLLIDELEALPEDQAGAGD
jgi:amino acid adenylation domain-containing protein